MITKKGVIDFVKKLIRYDEPMQETLITSNNLKIIEYKCDTAFSDDELKRLNGSTISDMMKYNLLKEIDIRMIEFTSSKITPYLTSFQAKIKIVKPKSL